MVGLFRFLYGYIVFAVSGSRPGSFVSILVRSGVNVWGIRSNSGDIICCARLADYPYVQELAKRNGRRVRIMKKRGLPFVLQKNKKRSGLVVGALLFALIFHMLSGYVWNIDYCQLDSHSQTSVKNTLERVGFYEGVSNEFESLKRMQTTAMLEFGNLSWITLNSDGSRGEVNATEKSMPETNDTAPRNMKAKTDGMIIRIDPYSGAATVSPGDAVVKGNLLISGVVQTELGGTHFERADGIVLAETKYNERFDIPKTVRMTIFDDEPQKRYACRIFGIFFPLSADRISDNTISFVKEEKANFFGENASVSLITEYIYDFNMDDAVLDKAATEVLMQKQMLLRELFKYGGRDIKHREISLSEDNHAYHFTVSYSCEEDIAAPSPIFFLSNISSSITNNNE